MPAPTKTFRVFVSSTFTDMREERSILQRDVFPRLEKYCAENGAKFQAVDLRWGVTEESSLSQKTLEICLNEIARCQKISPKPNFLILLGNKYGWQPVPPKIPANEMAALLQALAEDGRELLETWYQLDTNAMPSEYLLQPRDQDYTHYDNWKKVENKIREVLRTAILNVHFSATQQSKYFSSATHQEIVAGALDLDEDLEHPSGHVLALERVLSGLPHTKDFIDLDATGNPDEECQIKLGALKEELKDLLGDGKNYKSYPADWNGDKPVLEDPEAFAHVVYEFLKDIIEQQIKLVINPDEIKHEQNLHQTFKNSLTEHFSGRVNVLEQIGSYINKDPDQKPLSLIGASGSGKSSVMAQAIHEIEEKYPDAVLMYRFIGATSGSTSLISLLQSVGGQIATAFGTTLESMANFENQSALYELSSLSEIFKQCLALSTSEKPIYVFLDALDQLSNYEGNSFYWLPAELPEHTRFIISTLPDLEPALGNTSIIHLPVLHKMEAEQIIAKWLDASKRTLTPSQQHYLLDQFNETGLALYLKLAFEQARKWHSYTEDFTLQDDVPGIINDYIDSLRVEHDEEFIQDAICLMLCGRYQGLAENEILEIFAFDEELWDKFLKNTHQRHRQELIDIRAELTGSMKIPIVVWSRLFLDLEPYLTERDADGVPIIAFFHRQFNEVLGRRYGLVETEK